MPEIKLTIDKGTPAKLPKLALSSMKYAEKERIMPIKKVKIESQINNFKVVVFIMNILNINEFVFFEGGAGVVVVNACGGAGGDAPVRVCALGFKFGDGDVGILPVVVMRAGNGYVVGLYGAVSHAEFLCHHLTYEFSYGCRY